ncbi:hypothetical protein [Phenylobacterium sp.]|uniref:hypothetical protein n=1 Tax=Phenylobacterium sp. TaxID=1871053 RepID=UPI002BDF48C3|nr:hypothetical protein [Phenylobacterium sp.]HLZ76615.1 hypothetical protein [Phenylobacterium sp.]
MPRPISLAAPLLAALALSACGNDKPPSTAPPPDTASNFAQPFDARGFDPEWGLKIRGGQITLTRAGQPDLAGTAPGAAITDHSATWTVALADRQTMKVSLYASSCTDASSGATYGYSAEVTLPDATPLSGCAGPPAASAAATPAKP